MHSLRLRPLVLAGALASLTAGSAVAQSGGPLPVGRAAPDFTLPAATQAGVLPQQIRLAELRGNTVVLAFFYKARTKG